MTSSLELYARDMGWQPDKMVRLDQFKEEIERARYDTEPPIPWAHIVKWLRDIHQIEVSESALRRRVKSWKNQEGY